MVNLNQFLTLSTPVLSILTTAILVMLIDLFKPKSLFSTYIAYFGIIIAGLFAWQLYPIQSTSLWNNLFVVDNASCIMQLFIALSVFLCIYYASARLSDLESARGDVLSLYLLSTVGMMLLVQSTSMVSLYLSLELTSLPLYALVASQRLTQGASEASVKFFILGAVASVFLLFGMSLLYGLTGQLILSEIALSLGQQVQHNLLMILLAMIFIIAGASFKMALVPFHSWLPDVYVGAHPIMTLFLSAAPKIAGLGIFLRLSMAGLFELTPIIHQILALIALLSITVGNFSALVQKDLRRLLAYSTISHMGYSVLGFVAGGQSGQSAALFYLLSYSLMTILAFATILLPASKEHLILTVEHLKGLGKRSPWFAAMLMIVFFSMAGVPPAIGFFAKFFVIRALVNAGFLVYASLALILAVVGAFYYLNLIRVMYFESSEHDTHMISVNPVTKTIFVVQALAILALGLFPNLFVTISMQSF